MLKRSGQMSDTVALGIMLAVVGGFMDAYTYICRDGVFANAQTGNIVLFGIKAVEGDFSSTALYLLPVLCFFAGILCAEIIKKHFRTHPKIHWRQIIVLIELVALLTAAFIPSGEYNIAVNMLISFVCSLQVESFRKVKGIPYATTMCTGNLRSATEQLYLFRQTGDKRMIKNSLRYFGVILSFVIGAAGGAALTKLFSEKSVLFCCGILFIVFLAMFIKTEENSTDDAND